MVMNAAFLAQYTPLETLLFFQSLRAYSLNAINFGKISGELTNLPLVRNDATYDTERLSADALKNLYLNLVKEEARSDFEKALQDNNGQQNGDLSPPSRKRKAPSPPLPTVEEAAKNSHLLPRLLYRLYTRFRDSVVVQIKNEERQYDHLTREIDQLEQGKWDEGFRQEAQRQNPAPPPPPPQGLGVSLAGERPQQATFVDAPQRPILVQTQEKPSAPAPDQVERRASDARPSSARASIDALVNHTPVPEDGKPPLRKGSSNIAPLPPLSEMAPDQPPAYASPNLARAGHHTASPHMQSPAQRQAHYHPSPPVGHQSPYSQPYQHPQAASPSPKIPNAMAGQSPGSPHRVLPLPPGMKAAQSPVMPNGLPPHQRPPPQVQQHPYASPTPRPPPPVAPNDRQPQRGYIQHPSHVSTPQGYYPQQSPYQPYQGSPQTPQYHAHPHPQQQQQPAPYPLRASQQGGFQLPPFQVSAQEPVKNQAQQQQQQQQQIPHQGTPQSARHPVSLPSNARSVAQPPYGQYSPYPQTPQSRLPTTPSADGLTQSVVASLKQSRPSTSRRRSTWKAQNSPGAAPIIQPPRSPSIEPLSPVRKPVVLAQKESSPEPAEPVEPAPAEEPEEVIKFEKPRKQTRRTRGNSIASSVVPSSTRGRTRSQSVMSQANELSSSADKSTRNRKVKDEPSTPAETPRDDEPADDATPGPGRSTRARRGPAAAQPPQKASGRRRQTSTPAEEAEESAEEDFPPYNPPRNDVVHATRNFARLSAVILNEITAHRYAGSFQKPVSSKDVDGYTDIIKRPQDLKSIKAAITAGSRAIAAASAKEATTDSPAGTPAKDSSTLVLEKTADLVPPKAIVNSAQLECEVMRMFANAVLFNPGNEALVRDARDMSEDIAAKIRDWRAVERQGGEDSRDDDDDGTTVESAKGTKRRKL